MFIKIIFAGDLMELNKTIIILITIIGMVVAAAVVCATTVHATDNLGYENGDVLDVNYDATNSSLQLNSGANDLNETNTNSTNMLNSTGHAAGGDINATGNATNTTNSAGHAAGGIQANATGNATSHNMLATGNPILILLSVMGVIGVYSIRRR